MYDQKNTRPEGRVPRGKQRSHWKGVVRDRRHDHRVSRISAAEERNVPEKMVAEMRAMQRECAAGMGPRGRGRQRRKKRRRWMNAEAAT